MNITSLATTTLLILCGTFAVGCDDKADATGTTASSSSENKKAAAPKSNRIGSCDVKKTDGYCRQFGEKNFEAAGKEHLESMCHGTFSLKACPGEKAVGTCATPEGSKVFYSDGPIPTTAASGKKQCAEGIPKGKWSDS